MDFNKPRVSIWYYVVPQTGYRNDGPPLFLNVNLRRILDGVEPFNDHSVMRMDGGNVIHFQPNEPYKQHGTFDLNILVDHGEDGIMAPLDFVVPHPNAYWTCDTHIDSHGYQYRLNRAKEFDHVFLCHEAQIAAFVRDGIDPAKIHYLPLGAEPSCYKPFPIMEKWDWCFVGHMNSEHRMDMVDRFIKEFGIGDGKGYLGWRMPQMSKSHNILEDVARKFSMSRIVINDAINQDLNMRVFEALACRRPLLTQDIEPVRKYFKDGEHLVLYKDLDHAVELAKGLLADPARRTRIAEAGYQEIISKHTYNHRALEILKICLQWEPKGELVPC